MKKDWRTPRSREDVERQIPEEYLSHDDYTQNRRQLSFLMQEAAFSKHYPIYCAIDVDLLPEEQKEWFRADFPVKGAVVLGQTIKEMFLFAEQDVSGTKKHDPISAAELITIGYLMDMREMIEMQGYKAEILPPSVIPDYRLSDMMAASGKGLTGKNGRFIAGSYGSKISVGMILTDMPLMGGDYRFPDMTDSPCIGCRKCINACPAKAFILSEENEDYKPAFDREKCINWRNDPDNTEYVAEHTRRRCMKCLEVCPI